MNTRLFMGVLAAACIAPSAKAVYTYNIIDASVSFVPNGNGSIPWFLSGPADSKIDFDFGAVPVIVGDSTGRAAASVSILYEVDANGEAPVSAIGMAITGTLFDKGRIGWTEIVEDMSGNVVGSASGNFLGDSYDGGSNGTFTYTTTLNFSQTLAQYKVKKSFFLDIGDSGLPTSSLAAIGIVEQNIVPEPATIVAFGAGLALLLRRSLKRS